MTENALKLKNVALGVLFFAIIIAALWLVSVSIIRRDKARICDSHFKAIISASKDYARQHGTGYQTNLICLSNQLISPVKLLCVDDHVRRQRVREKENVLEGQWVRLTMDDCSYEVSLRDSNTLVLRCPFHKIGMRTVGGIEDVWTNYEREKR